MNYLPNDFEDAKPGKWVKYWMEEVEGAKVGVIQLEHFCNNGGTTPII